MILGIHHIGIVVQNDQHLQDLLTLFGLQVERRYFVEKYGADCVFTTGAGAVLEFIIPVSGPLEKFNRGAGGLHHIAFLIDDFDELTHDLEQQGATLLEQNPVNAGPIDINFLDPAFTRGVIVEYVKKSEARYGGE